MAEAASCLPHTHFALLPGNWAQLYVVLTCPVKRASFPASLVTLARMLLNSSQWHVNCSFQYILSGKGLVLFPLMNSNQQKEYVGRKMLLKQARVIFFFQSQCFQTSFLLKHHRKLASRVYSLWRIRLVLTPFTLLEEGTTVTDQL